MREARGARATPDVSMFRLLPDQGGHMVITPAMFDPAFGIYSLLADDPPLAGMPYLRDARV